MKPVISWALELHKLFQSDLFTNGTCPDEATQVDVSTCRRSPVPFSPGSHGSASLPWWFHGSFQLEAELHPWHMVAAHARHPHQSGTARRWMCGPAQKIPGRRRLLQLKWLPSVAMVMTGWEATKLNTFEKVLFRAILM